MTTNYQKMIEKLITYFKSGESRTSHYKLGMELEHFVLEKENLKAVPYQGDNGIEAILNDLVELGWEPVYENEHLLGLKGKKADISLEPGSQLELSLHPVKSLQEIELIYDDFLKQLFPILEERNKVLLTTGYQPVSKIAEIKLLPKKRYHYMYEYFKTKGKFAHNMMKGTSSIQLNLDYSNEVDCRKKMRVAYFLAPLIYYLFDNGPFFEGEVFKQRNIRSIIWENCDNDRCGFVNNIFEDDFGYQDYADYILNMPAIVTLRNNETVYTGQKLIKDIFEVDSFTEQEIDHFLTMAFPDVRLKKYIEIRMGDSLPYPFNLAYIAFWQGLLYNNANLDYLYNKAKDYDKNDLINISNEISINGLNTVGYGKTISEFVLELIEMAAVGLDKNELKYLNVIKDIVLNETIPKMKTLNKYRISGKKKEALAWCMAKGGLFDVEQSTESI